MWDDSVQPPWDLTALRSFIYGWATLIMGHPLFDLLRELEAAAIHFTLGRHREDTILVTLTLVGERVEIDVFKDGHMEVSRFPGSEQVEGGEEMVHRLISENRD